MRTKTVKTSKSTCTTTTTGSVKQNSLTANIIALIKRVVIVSDDSQDNRIAVATIQAHLMQYRYMLSEEAFLALSRSDLSKIELFHNEVIYYLKEAMGGSGYTPLYKNFPLEVMSKKDYELYWNAIMHYWSKGTWEPASDARFEKAIRFENVKYNELKHTTLEAFGQIFTDICSVGTSLTLGDMNILQWFAHSELELKFPAKIPFKENLCTLAAMGLNVPVKTPTDVLRIAVHMSGGDISLPAVPNKLVKLRGYTVKSENPERSKFKFRKFKRSERKHLLNLLEKTGADAREMVLKDQRWVRLAEILHPGEYKSQFPKCFEAFTAIRGGLKPVIVGGKKSGKRDKTNKVKVRSWYSGLTKTLYKDLDLDKGLKILIQRPGEFVRRIDWLVRTFTYGNHLEQIMLAFRESVKNTSNKVLFEVYTHFENRLIEKNDRSVFVKGARKKTPLPILKPLAPALVESIHQAIFAALKDKYALLPALGNCWIDEELKKIPLPTNMRSMNESLKPVIRGQRISFDNPNCKVIRPFVHWQGPTDLDLSGTFIRKKKNGNSGLTGYHGVLSYTNLKLDGSCHSGDVRGRSGNCAEYLDIDIASALEQGYKYVMLDVRNFDAGYGDKSLKDVSTRFGLMEREYPESNSTWLPETVTNCMTLTAKGENVTICMLDLEKKEYVMLDLEIAGRTAAGNTAELIKLVNEYCNPPKVSVYDLILMHVESRGRQVNLDNHVDVHFKKEDFCNDYIQTAKLMGV